MPTDLDDSLTVGTFDTDGQTRPGVVLGREILAAEDTDPWEVCPRCRRCVLLRQAERSANAMCSDPACGYRPGVVFDPERHLDHARICPACSSLLRQCDKGWECANSECPVLLTEDEMSRLLGRATQPRIEP